VIISFDTNVWFFTLALTSEVGSPVIYLHIAFYAIAFDGRRDEHYPQEDSLIWEHVNTTYDRPGLILLRLIDLQTFLMEYLWLLWQEVMH